MHNTNDSDSNYNLTSFFTANGIIDPIEACFHAADSNSHQIFKALLDMFGENILTIQKMQLLLVATKKGYKEIFTSILDKYNQELREHKSLVFWTAVQYRQDDLIILLSNHYKIETRDHYIRAARESLHSRLVTESIGPYLKASNHPSIRSMPADDLLARYFFQISAKDPHEAGLNAVNSNLFERFRELYDRFASEFSEQQKLELISIAIRNGHKEIVTNILDRDHQELHVHKALIFSAALNNGHNELAKLLHEKYIEAEKTNLNTIADSLLQPEIFTPLNYIAPQPSNVAIDLTASVRDRINIQKKADDSPLMMHLVLKWQTMPRVISDDNTHEKTTPPAVVRNEEAAPPPSKNTFLDMDRNYLSMPPQEDVPMTHLVRKKGCDEEGVSSANNSVVRLMASFQDTINIQSQTDDCSLMMHLILKRLTASTVDISDDDAHEQPTPPAVVRDEEPAPPLSQNTFLVMARNYLSMPPQDDVLMTHLVRKKGCYEAKISNTK